MGLDIHLKGIIKFYHSKNRPKIEGLEVITAEVRLGYWRKDYALHDVMSDRLGCTSDLEDYYLSLEQIEIVIKAASENKINIEDKYEYHHPKKIEEYFKLAYHWLKKDPIYREVIYSWCY